MVTYMHKNIHTTWLYIHIYTSMCTPHQILHTYTHTYVDASLVKNPLPPSPPLTLQLVTVPHFSKSSFSPLSSSESPKFFTNTFVNFFARSPMTSLRSRRVMNKPTYLHTISNQRTLLLVNTMKLSTQ